MTREELIYEICPYKSMIDCHSEEPYTHFKCKDCSILMNKWFDEYDKHVIEQYKADTKLKDTIREIHDNVAREMYCKGIDDMVKNLIANSRTEIIDEKLMLIVTEERIKTVANEMKKRLDS